ncbi:toll/interleukin-1 receptor domain-containing protein [Acidicapsa ligni]|uniref:toll/interleukin-1 receptor domain-containing protein n=1 Tax=Acidicapsa ligni TaxID=542300 RepID=UPI0021E018A4|nr:toll/interleukin-1 receptor domain-containing protein [Acidicapsa ligni]
MGKSLRPAINKGLINSSYAIVVLSKPFLAARKWTEHELNGLFAREKVGRFIILPIWHGIEHEDLVNYDPALAEDRLTKGPRHRWHTRHRSKRVAGIGQSARRHPGGFVLITGDQEHDGTQDDVAGLFFMTDKHLKAKGFVRMQFSNSSNLLASEI